MKRIVTLFVIITLTVSVLFAVSLIKDKISLSNEMVRLHVIAQSDSPEDQQTKMLVKDAVLSYLQNNMPEGLNINGVRAYLTNNLKQLESAANTVLLRCGRKEKASVSFSKEEYPTRHYDTFSLPSGVYESLRVVIGEGAGKNWWCVVFPALCMGNTEQTYKDLAVSAGMSETLVNTTVQKNGYEIRFFILDCIGKVENFFHFR